VVAPVGSHATQLCCFWNDCVTVSKPAIPHCLVCGKLILVIHCCVCVCAHVQQRQGGGDMMGGMGRGRGRGMDNNRFGGEWGPGGSRFDGTTYIIPADKCGLVIGKGKEAKILAFFWSY